jgi:hypothetical protein
VKWVYLFEVVGSLIPGVIYGVLAGLPRKHRDRPMARLVTAWVWVAVAWESALLAALLGVLLPAWVAVLVLLGPMVVSWWRLIVRLQDKGGRHGPG